MEKTIFYKSDTLKESVHTYETFEKMKNAINRSMDEAENGNIAKITFEVFFTSTI